MGGFKIEKGVPFKKGGCRYPFKEMDVGDSFFVEVPDGKDPLRIAQNVRTSARQNRVGGAKFSVKKVDGGFRCWRIK